MKKHNKKSILSKKKFVYLNKEFSRVWKRKDGKIVEILITNKSDEKLKIRKEFDKKIKDILKLIFLDNGEYIE